MFLEPEVVYNVYFYAGLKLSREEEFQIRKEVQMFLNSGLPAGSIRVADQVLNPDVGSNPIFVCNFFFVPNSWILREQGSRFDRMSFTVMGSFPRDVAMNFDNWVEPPLTAKHKTISDYRRYLTLHEFLHVLGFDHSEDNRGIMCQQTKAHCVDYSGHIEEELHGPVREHLRQIYDQLATIRRG